LISTNSSNPASVAGLMVANVAPSPASTSLPFDEQALLVPGDRHATPADGSGSDNVILG
jgi:hypothetical protein